MALPGVDVTIQDGGLGVLPSDADGVFATFGVCSKGTANQVYSFSDPSAARASLGFGPLSEAVALKIAQGGGTQIAVPVTPAFDSVVGSVTSVVSGTGTLVVKLTNGPIETITIECLTTAALGTAVFRFTVGSNDPYIATSAAGWATGYQVVGTLTKLTFTAGNGFDDGDIWTTSTTGVVTFTTNAGASTGTIAATGAQSQIIDSVKVRIEIMKAGAASVGRFRYAVDNYTDSDGNSLAQYSGEIVIPANPYYYAIPNTGLVVTFDAGTYAVGDVFTFDAVPSSMANADLTTAMTALQTSGAAFSMVHVCSTYSATNDAGALTAADTLAGVVDTNMVTLATAFKYARALVETPSSGTMYIDSDTGPAPATSASSDAALVVQFQDFASTRGIVAVGGGDALLYSVLTGRLHRRNGAWIEGARLAGVNRAVDPGKVLDGPLGGVVRRIYADQNSSDTLDGGRFMTLRTYQGLPGYYVTRGVSMASEVSDFSNLCNGRVMDRACEVARTALLRYVNSEVRVDPVTGYIDEGEALRIEAAVNGQLNAALVATGQASATSVTLSRTTNILSTSTEPVTIRVTPLGYLRSLEMTIGFINPALAAA